MENSDINQNDKIVHGINYLPLWYLIQCANDTESFVKQFTPIYKQLLAKGVILTPRSSWRYSMITEL